ncbi:hypothetical protein HNQ51_000951 [Inhella inkyongensis]|uniref:Uncharacterized protein n=1 Tax=Inhella inkyongensis TaxID=392593 RepID=A0A840S2M9_9BURK|nr:hypothetical protein [Inhella inkyongensis]MBB5203658.1 hypothetical protein [Inhella inkyongensis]
MIRLLKRAAVAALSFAAMAAYVGPNAFDSFDLLFRGPTPEQRMQRIEGTLVAASACRGERNNTYQEIEIQTLHGIQSIWLSCSSKKSTIAYVQAPNRRQGAHQPQITAWLEPYNWLSRRSERLDKVELDGVRIFQRRSPEPPSAFGLLFQSAGWLMLLAMPLCFAWRWVPNQLDDLQTLTLLRGLTAWLILPGGLLVVFGLFLSLPP